MAISFPQYKSNINAVGGTATLSTSFTNPIAAGSIIAVAVVTDPGITTFTVSDDKIDAVTDSGLGIIPESVIGTKIVIKAFLTATTGAQTVTLTTDVNFAFAELIIWEIAGLTGAIVDKKITNITTGTTAATSGSTGTLSASAEAAIAYGISNDFYSASDAAWTTDALSTPTAANLTMHRILASNAAISATATVHSAVDAQINCVTFMSGTGDTFGNNMVMLIM